MCAAPKRQLHRSRGWLRLLSQPENRNACLHQNASEPAWSVFGGYANRESTRARKEPFLILETIPLLYRHPRCVPTNQDQHGKVISLLLWDGPNDGAPLKVTLGF